MGGGAEADYDQARSPSDGEEGADGDGADAEAGDDALEAAPLAPTTAAMTAAMTEAAAAGAEAAATAIRDEIKAALTALRDDLKAWAEAAVTNAADREVTRRLDASQAQFEAELRSATEAWERAGQAADPVAAAPETAAPAADRAEAVAGPAAEPALLGDPVPEAPPASRLIDSLRQPANPGLNLKRPVSYDLLGEASQWLGSLGIDEAERERLRVGATAADPAEGLRKLFASLHMISAERRLASDRPTLKWERVGQASLADFIGRIHPGLETCLIWPHVGDAYDPRTMYHLQKSESGPGVLTEVVAPGYSAGAGEDPVKAAVID